MLQQGQVFKLKAKSADGQPMWAYRYRVEGRASLVPKVGGFASRAEAQKALRKALDRIGPGRGGAITLAELVEEYLELHQAEPVTIAKLRWLLNKATTAFGEKRIADLSPSEVYAWRSTLPEGHRFEATQALRQVLNRAVAWGLLEFNPAKRGVPNPQRRPKEKGPFESWAQIEAVAARLDLFDRFMRDYLTMKTGRFQRSIAFTKASNRWRREGRAPTRSSSPMSIGTRRTG